MRTEFRREYSTKIRQDQKIIVLDSFYPNKIGLLDVCLDYLNNPLICKQIVFDSQST